MSTRLGTHTIPIEAGFRTGLVIGCGVSVLAALVTLAIPVRKPAAPPQDALDLEPAAARARVLARAPSQVNRRATNGMLSANEAAMVAL
ncbi:hypothetical protein IU470_30060 [Nocardia abscessus]|uniref:MFS transporter n=1 Tax=Nocardia abscessus TaxID=120957 RepID=A0ABS0CIH9_9NOCA|nr:hypothetical protein [Nocardia abscessus]